MMRKEDANGGWKQARTTASAKSNPSFFAILAIPLSVKHINNVLFFVSG